MSEGESLNPVPAHLHTAYAYQVKPNMADKPVNFVSWFDAAQVLQLDA